MNKGLVTIFELDKKVLRTLRSKNKLGVQVFAISSQKISFSNLSPEKSNRINTIKSNLVPSWNVQYMTLTSQRRTAG